MNNWLIDAEFKLTWRNNFLNTLNTFMVFNLTFSVWELMFVRSPFTQKRAKQRVNVWSFHHLFSHGLSPPPPFGNRFWPSFTFSFFLCYVIAFVKNPGHHRWARISFFSSPKRKMGRINPSIVQTSSSRS